MKRVSVSASVGGLMKPFMASAAGAADMVRPAAKKRRAREVEVRKPRIREGWGGVCVLEGADSRVAAAGKGGGVYRTVD